MRSLSLVALLPFLALACSSSEELDGEGADGGSTGTTSSGGASGGNVSSSGGASSGGASSGSSSSGGASSGSSSGGVIEPSHTDGIKNGDETGVDCGGAQATPCAPEGGCLLPRDCTSQVCAGNVCSVPNDADGVKNGDETGVDCGGPTTPKLCAPSQGCALPGDCQQGVCINSVCAPATSVDGLKNGDETDVDCGGALAAACEPHEACLLPRDCSSQICEGNLCTEPSDDDGVKNGDETGVDCGGPTTPNLCAPAQGCAIAADCQQGVCTANVCAAASTNDGVKNGTETGIDCGGPVANPRCAPGFGCAAPADCTEGVCAAQLCSAPTDTDGVQNQGELAVDCGGPNTVKTCAAGTTCAEAADCTSGACTHLNKCADYRSCKAHHGGDTCGSGETFDAPANRAHESCCTTIPVTAASNVKLDKYNITAGRMRAFVEATAGNIKQWVADNPPAGWRADWSNYLPTGLNTPMQVVQGTMRNLGVHGQLGPNFVYDQAGDFGCWSGAAVTGAPTYWMPKADRTAQQPNDVGSLYSKDYLDQKPLNCVNAVMLAAFCAWDGGRLPTITEIDAAWNGPATRTYPWGTQVPGGYAPSYPNPDNLTPAGSDPLRANFKHNYPQTSAKWNAMGAAWGLAGGLQGKDEAWYIAPPGRFPTGAGPYGHQDLGGAVFNATSTYSGSASDTLSMNSRWSRSGSWENAHGIPYGVHTSPVLRKYWAQGGRCVKN